MSLLTFSILFTSVYADIDLKLKPINGPIQGNFMDQTIGIFLSRTTLIQSISNINDTNYPSYKTLLPLDTSVKLSGEFKEINGIFKREIKSITNEENLYSWNPDNIILDPSYRLKLKTKTIEILPSLNAYVPKDEMIKVNNTRVIYKNISIDEECKHAKISLNNWNQTLHNMIFFLRSNCDEQYTNLFDSKDIIIDKKTEIDITTTSQYKYNQWLKEALAKSKSTFLIK